MCCWYRTSEGIVISYYSLRDGSSESFDFLDFIRNFIYYSHMTCFKKARIEDTTYKSIWMCGQNLWYQEPLEMLKKLAESTNTFHIKILHCLYEQMCHCCREWMISITLNTQIFHFKTVIEFVKNYRKGSNLLPTLCKHISINIFNSNTMKL